MGIRSDIEEIQIEEDVNTDEDSSNQGSERQLRARNPKKKKAGKYGKLINKERQEFLGEFDQSVSEREKRKQNKKHNYKDSGRGKITKKLTFQVTYFSSFQGVPKTMSTTRKES